MAESNRNHTDSAPGTTPVRPTADQMDLNEREARAEIGRRARDLAERCVEHGEAVTPQDLGPLGPAGQAYFFEMLRKGIDAKLQPQRPPVRWEPAAALLATTSPLRNIESWSDQRRDRAGYVRRAAESGLWLAAYLTLLTVIALHLRADWDLLEQVLTITGSTN